MPNTLSEKESKEIEKYAKSEDFKFKLLDAIPFGFRMQRYYFDVKLWIKNLYQKTTKGYADSETWSLDTITARWILPRLKHLRDNVYGTPPNLEKYPNSFPSHCVVPDENIKPEDRYDLSLEDWKKKIDQMIFAFDFILNEDKILDKCYPADFVWGFDILKKDGEVTETKWKDERKPDYTFYDEQQKKYEEGMKVFCLYFRHLWD